MGDNYEEIRYFAKKIRKRVRNDWDLVIAITGERGAGKSTLSAQLGQFVDQKFDMDKNIAYLPNEREIINKFNKLKRYQYFSVDEAVRALYKMQFMNKLQQTVVQMYNTERYQNKITALLIPRFRDLTEGFRNHLVKIWIHVYARGFAVAYVMDNNVYAKDPWHLDENYKRHEKSYKRMQIVTRDIDTVIDRERQSSNYFYDFKFPDMPETMRAQYDHYRQLYRDQFNNEPQENGHNMTVYEKKYKRALFTTVKNLRDNGLPWDNVERVMGIPASTLQAIYNSDKPVKLPRNLGEQAAKTYPKGEEIILPSKGVS